MKRMKKRNYFAVGVLAGLLAAFVAVLILFHGFAGLRGAWKLSAALQVFDRYFVTDYDVDAVIDGAMQGAVSGLDDRWSYYMTAEEFESYQDYSANRYQGIGVTIQKDSEIGGFLIVSLTRDGPAALAGLVAGDVILSVEGISTEDMDTIKLREYVQEAFGRTVCLEVLHEDGSVQEYAVSCEEVYSSPVTYELLRDGVGYVSIENFREGAANEAIAAIEELIGQGAERLLFDVRNNPGGQLTELVALLDYLLPEGDIFIRTDKNGRETAETSDADCVEMPMAVLVNGDSYSAAEFFAAALQEYDWADVVGEATTGKARSQITVALEDGSAIHLSRYSYLTPQRVDLYEQDGIEPDVEVSLSEEERLDFDTGWLEPEDDPQIQSAIDILAS